MKDEQMCYKKNRVSSLFFLKDNLVKNFEGQTPYMSTLCNEFLYNFKTVLHEIVQRDYYDTHTGKTKML